MREIRLSVAAGSAAWLIMVACIPTASAHDHPIRHSHLGGSLAPDYANIQLIRYHDVVYDDSAPDTHRTSLDIYVPEPARDEPMPVTVYLHSSAPGAALASGDKAYAREIYPKTDWFTHRLGHVFVSINYRFLPEGRYPVNVQDVANALAWVHDNIAEFGGDPDHLFVMGQGAGAALLGQVATDERFLQNAGKDLDILRGVIPIEGGTYDITEEGVREAGGQGTGFQERIFGDDPERWREASPRHQVEAGKGIPPFLMLHVRGGTPLGGGSSQTQARMMAETLEAAGVPVEVVGLPVRDHSSANESIGVPGELGTDTVRRFLESLTDR